MRINVFTDKNLMAYLAKGWSEDKLVQGKIKTLTGRTIHVDGVESNWEIIQLKHAIEDKEGIPVEKQTLKKGKKLLENKQRLNESFIQDGTTLLMFIDGEGVDFTPPSDSAGGLKTKERTEGSKVVVLDPTEEGAKEESGNWWDKSQMSGPKSAPARPSTSNINSIPNTTQTTTTDTTTATPTTTTTTISTTQSTIPSQEEQRSLRLKAIEARMKH